MREKVMERATIGQNKKERRMRKGKESYDSPSISSRSSGGIRAPRR
jgi:hypothetical protein